MSDLLRLAFVVWARETSRITGMTKRAAIAAAILGLCLLAILGYGSISVFRDFTADLDDRTIGDLSLILVSLGNSYLLTSMVVGAVFGLLTADPTAMDNLLHIAGANRRQRLAVGLAPSVVVSIAIAMMIAFPLLAPVPSVTRNPLAGLAIIGAGVVLVIFGAVLSFGVHRLLAIVARHRLHLPVIHANALSAGLTISLAIALCAPGFRPSLRSEFPYRWLPAQVPVHLYLGLEEDRTSDLFVGLALLIPLIVVTVVALYAAASALRDLGTLSALRTFHGRPIFGRSRFAAMVWYEVVSLARAPTTLLSLIGTLGLSLVAVALRNASYAQLIALLPGAIAGAIGVQATGLNLRSAWSIWSINGKTPLWGWSKLIATAGASVALYLTAGLPIVFVFGLPLYAGGAYLTLLPVLASSLLAGAIVPVSSDQPVSAAMAGGLTFFLGVVGLLAIDRSLGFISSSLSSVTPPVFAACCVASFLAVTGRIKTETTVNQE